MHASNSSSSVKKGIGYDRTRYNCKTNFCVCYLYGNSRLKKQKSKSNLEAMQDRLK